MRRTYLDAGVLIAAYQAMDQAHRTAVELLADEERHFIGSDVLKLETIPVARRHGYNDEADFYEDFFENVAEPLQLNGAISVKAIEILSGAMMGVMDALHLSSAVIACADEFVTTESETKPFFRINVFPMIVTRII